MITFVQFGQTCNTLGAGNYASDPYAIQDSLFKDDITVNSITLDSRSVGRGSSLPSAHLKHFKRDMNEN